jgi:hypothetical protein
MSQKPDRKHNVTNAFIVYVLFSPSPEGMPTRPLGGGPEIINVPPHKFPLPSQ